MVSSQSRILMRSGSFLSQKMVSMIFRFDGEVLNFLLLVSVCGTIALIVAYSQVCDDLSQYSPESRHLDPCNVQGMPALQPLDFSCDGLSTFSAPNVRTVSDSLIFL
jgi:hypothetical protein